MVFCKNNPYLLSGTSDFKINIWDGLYSYINFVRTLHGHTAAILAIASDPTRIFSSSRDKTIKVWTWEGLCLKSIKAGIAVALEFEDEKIYVGTNEGISVYSLKSDSFTLRIGNKEAILSLKISNHSLVSTSEKNTIKLWNKQNGNLLSTLIGHNEGVITTQFLRDAVISVSFDNSVKLWKSVGGKTIDDSNRPLYSLQVADEKSHPLVFLGATSVIRVLELNHAMTKVVSTSTINIRPHVPTQFKQITGLEVLVLQFKYQRYVIESARISCMLQNRPDLSSIKMLLTMKRV